VKTKLDIHLIIDLQKTLSRKIREILIRS